MMMKLSAALAFAFVLLSLGGEEIRIHETSWSDRTPVLDGRIENDPAWEKIPWEPGGFFLHRKKLSPSNDTKFKSLYTADALYFAIQCSEKEMDKMLPVFNFGEFWKYDVLELFFQTGRNELIHLAVNPDGMSSDQIPGSVAKRTDFQIGWNCAAFRGKDAWYAEVCIPFFLLGKAPGKQALELPFNLCRHSTPAKEYSTWSFQIGPFNNTACFGSLRCLPPPPEKVAEVTESLSRPHWSSLIRRYRDMKGDPAWRSVLKKFPAETAVLERIYANPPDHSRKAALFGETLRRIENSVRDADARDRIRIRKLLFDE